MHIYESRASKYKAGGVRTPNSKEVKNDGQKWPIEDANVETLSFSFSITEWKMMDALYRSHPYFLWLHENWKSEKTNWLRRLLYTLRRNAQKCRPFLARKLKCWRTNQKADFATVWMLGFCIRELAAWMLILFFPIELRCRTFFFNCGIRAEWGLKKLASGHVVHRLFQ